MKCLLIVDDNRALLDSLVKDAHASSPDWKIVPADSMASAREALATESLDAVFLDLGLPDGDGLSLIGELRRAHPACEILVITVFADEHRVIQCLEAGASGYVLKSDLQHYAGRLIATIEAGGSSVSPAIARRLIERLQPGRQKPRVTSANDPLSARESEILALCAKGLRYAEIAQTLSISVHTVNAHLKTIYRKLMVNSRSEAVYEARQSGLLQDP